MAMKSDHTVFIIHFTEERNREQLLIRRRRETVICFASKGLIPFLGVAFPEDPNPCFHETRSLTGAGEGCFRGLFYEVSLALVGVASPA